MIHAPKSSMNNWAETTKMTFSPRHKKGWAWSLKNKDLRHDSSIWSVGGKFSLDFFKALKISPTDWCFWESFYEYEMGSKRLYRTKRPLKKEISHRLTFNSQAIRIILVLANCWALKAVKWWIEWEESFRLLTRALRVFKWGQKGAILARLWSKARPWNDSINKS